MYCSSCGVAVTQGLIFCNFCGAKLNQGDRAGKSAYIRPENLITMMVATFIMGTFALTVLMGVMKAVLGLDSQLIVALMTFPFILMVLLEAMFIFLLLRQRSDDKREGRVLPKRSTNELDSVRVLPEPGASVTENTTRAFDPVYGARR
jgi:hypothetical protein